MMAEGMLGPYSDGIIEGVTVGARASSSSASNLSPQGTGSNPSSFLISDDIVTHSCANCNLSFYDSLGNEVFQRIFYMCLDKNSNEAIQISSALQILFALKLAKCGKPIPNLALCAKCAALVAQMYNCYRELDEMSSVSSYINSYLIQSNAGEYYSIEKGPEELLGLDYSTYDHSPHPSSQHHSQQLTTNANNYGLHSLSSSLVEDKKLSVHPSPPQPSYSASYTQIYGLDPSSAPTHLSHAPPPHEESLETEYYLSHSLIGSPRDGIGGPMGGGGGGGGGGVGGHGGPIGGSLIGGGVSGGGGPMGGGANSGHGPIGGGGIMGGAIGGGGGEVGLDEGGKRRGSKKGSGKKEGEERGLSTKAAAMLGGKTASCTQEGCTKVYHGKGAKASLRQHIKTFHLKQFNHHCSICGKPLATKNLLEAHTKSHMGPAEKSAAAEAAIAAAEALADFKANAFFDTTPLSLNLQQQQQGSEMNGGHLGTSPHIHGQRDGFGQNLTNSGSGGVNFPSRSHPPPLVPTNYHSLRIETPSSHHLTNIITNSNSSPTTPSNSSTTNISNNGNSSGSGSNEGGRTNFYCSECNKYFGSSYSLNIHKNRSHQETPTYYPCDAPNCSRKFRDKSSLRRHQNSHAPPPSQLNSSSNTPVQNSQNFANSTHNSSSFSCERCKNAFKSARSLKEHSKNCHTTTSSKSKPREKNFICGAEGCKRKFHYKHHLQNHYIYYHKYSVEEARNELYPGLEVKDWMLKGNSNTSSPAKNNNKEGGGSFENVNIGQGFESANGEGREIIIKLEDVVKEELGEDERMEVNGVSETITNCSVVENKSNSGENVAEHISSTIDSIINSVSQQQQHEQL